MVRIAICDDNLRFTGEVETLVALESDKMRLQTETDVFFDGSTLLETLSLGNRYDLIFLDIEMKQLNGIDAARKIREIDKTVLLIYISGYDQYLKSLFEMEPFRFLSKPLDKDLFCRYFREACQRIAETDTYFQFSFNKELKKVPIKDIIYFESQSRVIHIVRKDGIKDIFYGKLNDIEKELAKTNQRFLRIHQSFLVNFDYVTKINFSSVNLTIENGPDICLKISEDRQKSVRLQLCKIIGKSAVVY